MKRRDVLRWVGLGPLVTLAAPALTSAGAAVSRVVPRVPRVEWVNFPHPSTEVSLVIDHVEMARFPRAVQLTAEALARYVAERAALGVLPASPVVLFALVGALAVARLT